MDNPEAANNHAYLTPEGRARARAASHLLPDPGGEVVRDLLDIIDGLIEAVEWIGQLTPREREVLPLLGEGLTNRQIARRLGISEKTVKAHVGGVLRTLGVADRTQAALVAARAGLVAADGS